MERDDILKKAAEKSIYLHEKLDAALGSHHNVGEIRHIGLINAIELVEDRESKRPFDPEKTPRLAHFPQSHGFGISPAPHWRHPLL